MRDNGAGLTTVDYLILGLVGSLQPCTSYDLKREVERSISHFWTFSHTALYQAPAQLVAAGLLTDEQEATGRRRRTYRLTDSGRERLAEWLGDTRAHSIELRDLALLKLFFLDHADPGLVRAHAESQAQYHAQRLEEFRALMSRQQPDPSDPSDPSHPTRMAVLRFGSRWEEAARDFWIELAKDEADNQRAGGGTPARDAHPAKGGQSQP